MRDEIFRIRINPMEVSSIIEFGNKEGSIGSQCRDVYFLRVKGMDAGRLQEVETIDRLLTEKMQAGNGFYYRGNQLPRLSLREDVDYYAGCYENWINARKESMENKSISSSTGSPLAHILADACNEVLALLGQEKAGLSASIEKNFVVKLLFWLDQTVSGALQAWKQGHSRKAVFGNICKKQEYLFCYLLTLLGFDVLLLQPGQDIDAESERLGLSKRIGKEIASQMAVPDYVPAQYQRGQAREVPAQYQHSHIREVPDGVRGNAERRQKAGKAPAIVDVRIPERDRRTEEMLRAKTSQMGQRMAQDQSGRQVSGGFRQERQQMPGGIQQQNIAQGHKGIWQGRDALQGRMIAGNAERRELPYEELALLASSVVLIMIHDAKGRPIGSGSGIMIGRDGYILTNNHVASGGRSYSVRIEEDDQVYQTDEMIKYNSVLDLAIIRIHRQLTPIPIYQGREKLARGQKVVAIGSPLGLFNSVSDGIISGFRVIDNVDMIQFTAPISHGSSGGAVLNMYGEVIGISTAGIDSGQNINLAVGYESIRPFVQGFL